MPMLSIEIKSRPNRPGHGLEDEQYVAVNGIADESSSYLGHEDDEEMLDSAYFENEEIIRILLSNAFSEVGRHFAFFHYNKKVEWWDDWIEIQIYCNEYFDFQIPSVKAFLCIEFEAWSRSWSISEYARELQQSIEILNSGNISYTERDGDILSNGFGIQYLVAGINNTIEPEVNKAVHALHELVVATNRRLLARTNRGSIVTSFQFPEEIQTACNQYLIYFTQFIADIGIEVNTEIKQEANRTLFKVTPKNKSEALSQIQEALDIYLGAPDEQNFQIQGINYNNVAVKQWEANIYHLKSQLALANSLLQAKEATIESLHLSNYQYRQLLQSKENQPERKEDLIDGVVSVTEYQGKGFSVNFAEILRRLKRIVK